MDFGLARASALGAAPDGRGETAAMPISGSHPITAAGTIVGTFQYMSPEHLEGRETDARSDIWALGCVLYEMATGKRAFEGKSQASLIGAIMNPQPVPISRLAPMSPPGLERLVKQCLTADPDERWQSAGDVRRELEWIAGSLSGSAIPATAASARRSRQGLYGWIAAGIVALSAAVLVLGPWAKRTTPTPLMRFSIVPPTGITLNTPAETQISPDGRTLVFKGYDSSLATRLYLRSLSSPDFRALPGTENAMLPFWSPDGSSIGFFSDGKLRRIALNGGASVALCDAPDARGGAWSTDGMILFAPNNQGPIARVSANGGSPVPVTQLDTTRHERGHRYPQFLPDGKHFLYVAVGSGELATTWAQEVNGGPPVEVCEAGSGARWVEGGYLLYLDTGVNSPRRRLLAQMFDPKGLSKSGDAELLIDPVSSSNFGYPNVTADGDRLVVQHSSREHFRFTRRDRTGRIVATVIEDIQTFGDQRLSPDGERMVYGGVNPWDVYVIDLGSGISTRLTFENRQVNNLIWSPDGQRIAFSRLSQAHGWQVHTKAADGTGPDSLLFEMPGLFSYALDWSRDGRWIIALCANTAGDYDLWKVPMDGSGEPEPYQRTPAQETQATFSPDGKWLSYTVDEGGKSALYVQSFPVPAAKYQVNIPDLMGAGWSPGRDEILVMNSDRMFFAVQVQTAGGFRQGSTHELFHLGTTEFFGDITSDGAQFLVGEVKEQALPSQLEVVLGWTQLLEKSR